MGTIGMVKIEVICSIMFSKDPLGCWVEIGWVGLGSIEVELQLGGNPRAKVSDDTGSWQAGDRGG